MLLCSKLDDLCIKLEYLQKWEVHTNADKSVSLDLKYGVRNYSEKLLMNITV